MLLMAAESAVKSDTPDVATWVWFAFFGVFFAAQAFFYLVFNRDRKLPTVPKATVQSLISVGLAVVIGLLLWAFTDMGSAGVGEWYASYFSELSLSVDNLFVMSIIIGQFAVPREYIYKVLTIGVWLAMFLRAIFILLGVQVIHKFEWVMIPFGLWLLFTAIKLLKEEFSDDDEEKPLEDRWSYRLFSKVMPTTTKLYGDKLIVVLDTGRRVVTSLFICLCCIGSVDILFALDSIPVVLGITHHNFTAVSSNLMAVTGLLPMYFLLSHLQKRISRLSQGVILLLAVIGVKLLVSVPLFMGMFGFERIEVSTGMSLAIIFGILLLSWLASVVFPKKTEEKPKTEDLLARSSNTMVEIAIAAGDTMIGEWRSGLVQDYLRQCIQHVGGRFDTDAQRDIPVWAFGERIDQLQDAHVGQDYVITERPSLGEHSDLAAALHYARARALKTNGLFIFAVMTDGRLKDAIAEREARSVFVTMPDNAFILFVRVSDEPGGAEFLQGLDDFNVGDADRCDTVHATDNAGNPLENIGEVVGREIEDWLELNRELERLLAENAETNQVDASDGTNESKVS